jgi:hypothetical protein
MDSKTAKQLDWLKELGPMVQDMDDPNLDLLHPNLRKCVIPHREHGHPMLKHPWVNYPFTIMVNQANKQYAAKWKIAREEIANRNWFVLLHIVVERPWRLETLIRRAKRGYFTDAELKDLVSSAWTDGEMIGHNVGFHACIDLFEIAGFVTDSEDDSWDKLPDVLTVYRGIDAEFGDSYGLAWTLSLERARWFAHYGMRGDSGGEVYKVEVPKQDVLGYFTGRAEEEIVIDPHGLEIEFVEEVERKDDPE